MSEAPELNYPAFVMGVVDHRRRSDEFDRVVEAAKADGLDENKAWRKESLHSFAGMVASDAVFEAVEQVDGVVRLDYISSLRQPETS